MLTTLVVVATPGTGALFTIAAGLSRGRRASLVAAVGCTVGIVPHMVAAIAGLAALLYTSSAAFSVLKYLGVAYLLLLAWRTLRDRSALTVDGTPVLHSDARVVARAFAGSYAVLAAGCAERPLDGGPAWRLQFAAPGCKMQAWPRSPFAMCRLRYGMNLLRERRGLAAPCRSTCG